MSERADLEHALLATPAIVPAACLERWTVPIGLAVLTPRSEQVLGPGRDR